MNRRTLLAVVVVIVVLLCVASGALVFWLQSQGGPAALIEVAPPTPTEGVQSNLPPETPLPEVPTSTEQALAQAQVPERDLYQIVPRLRKDLALLTPVPTPMPHPRQVGDQDTFYVIQNASTGQYRTVTATLKVVTPHAYYWVENGLNVDVTALQRSANEFEQKIYPTDHEYFGMEKSPGPDGDTHINILNTRFQDAAGYFSSEDTYPRQIVPYSNQRNIIYLNMDALRPGTDEYNADTAHELQHLIHSYEAEYKPGWVDEGMGDLAIKVNGFDVGGVLQIFARNTDTQLDAWSEDPQASLAHYGASYLFFDYAAGRFGPQFTRDVIHAPEYGIEGIQSVLDQSFSGVNFDQLFVDWAIANYVNDPSIDKGRYAYTNEPSFRVGGGAVLSQFPVSQTATIDEYAAEYYTVQPANGPVTVYFTGTTTVHLLPVNAHSGRWMWWSNRADLADMTLTRPVDLTRVNKATLQFWTWYDIEKNFDYAYVEVSTDGGKTWDILPGTDTTTSNPNGASYGPAYTGRSGASADNSSAPAQWIHEMVDLTPYTGKAILLRFEYITDDAYNAPSFAIDDIAIPEIGFSDNVESGNTGWQAEGFIRTDNVLPQHYIVSVVEMGQTPQVVSIPLDNQNRGKLTLTGLGQAFSKAVIVVTAEAPTTTEPSEYQIGVAPQ